MWIKFEGLDELIKEFESVSSEREIDKANVKIIKECAKVVEEKCKLFNSVGKASLYY